VLHPWKRSASPRQLSEPTAVREYEFGKTEEELDVLRSVPVTAGVAATVGTSECGGGSCDMVNGDGDLQWEN
jgi:hypothetical protein